MTTGHTTKPTNQTAKPTTGDPSAVVETLPYVPFDDVDYMLEKIELPLEDGYETTVMGYIRMKYDPKGTLGMMPYGLVNGERTEPLSEEERILPGYHPEKLSVMAKKTASDFGDLALYTYINDPSTPLEPFTRFDLRLTQWLSGKYPEKKYNGKSDIFCAHTDCAEYLVETFIIGGESQYYIYFDDGTYYFELWSGKTGISLDEMMKVVVSMNRPCRTVEEAPEGDTLSYPGAEKIDLKYTTAYITTVGKYRFEYDGFSYGFAYQTRGEQGNYTGHVPKLAGYSAKMTDSGS